MTYSCNVCKNRWGGLNTAHCSACHVTFSTWRSFDAHRSKGLCALPADVGLVPQRRAYECYGRPVSLPQQESEPLLEEG